jgi:hypothetical protein
MVPPLSDPLLFYPPSPRWTGLSDVTADFEEIFITAGLSEPVGNGTLLIFVFGVVMDNFLPNTGNNDDV